MAMKPFCGYNFADYWNYWLSFAGKSANLPKIFHVNWFRQDKDGKFMWPGFGENLRVLRWILDRCDGKTQAQDTAIGYVPTGEVIDTRGLNVDVETMRALLEVDPDKWREEMQTLHEYFRSYGERLPSKLREEHRQVTAALSR